MWWWLDVLGLRWLYSFDERRGVEYANQCKHMNWATIGHIISTFMGVAWDIIHWAGIRVQEATAAVYQIYTQIGMAKCIAMAATLLFT